MLRTIVDQSLDGMAPPRKAGEEAPGSTTATSPAVWMNRRSVGVWRDPGSPHAPSTTATPKLIDAAVLRMIRLLRSSHREDAVSR
jgi:hypothetical protein